MRLKILLTKLGLTLRSDVIAIRFGINYTLHLILQSGQNIMLVNELLLSLPFSTAKVEHFSTLKIIKNEKRTNLSCSTLNDLFGVNTEGPTLGNFSADAAVDLWWSDCSSGRRVNQKPRKEYRRHR